MISTAQTTSDSNIDKILVYNLFLSGEQVDLLNKCHKVQVVEFPAWVSDIYPEFLTPKQYAWKPFVIKDAASYGSNIFYLDSGAMLVRDIKDIYEKIEKNHIFVVGASHKNKIWTHDLCFKIMGASEEEKNANQICAGIQGYKPNGRFQRYVDQGFLYACIKSAVFGDRKNHRHDQSIYSVLVKRYGIEPEDIDIYGEWRGILIPPSVSSDLRSALRAATAAPQAHACEGKRPDGRARRLRASVKPDVSGFTLDDMRPDQAIYVHRRHFPVSRIDLRLKERPTR